MFRLSIVALILLVVGCAHSNGAKKDTTETKNIITVLASDEFDGRYPGTDGFEKAVNYVEDFFKSNNISPYFSSYRDTVMVNGVVSYNVVGLIGEHHPDKEYILLGAHLDHLKSVLNAGGDKIYNGANDNASGSTAVLQIGKNLSQKHYDKNILLVLFTGEESGLVGSIHLSNRLKEDSLKLAYMINFEMIGKTYPKGKNTVYMTGFDKSNMATEMNKLTKKEFVYFLADAKQMDLFYRSDNAPFYEMFNVPCHTLSSFDFYNYNFYHKVGDEVNQLDIENMSEIITTSQEIIEQLLITNKDIKLME